MSPLLTMFEDHVPFTRNVFYRWFPIYLEEAILKIPQIAALKNYEYLIRLNLTPTEVGIEIFFVKKNLNGDFDSETIQMYVTEIFHSETLKEIHRIIFTIIAKTINENIAVVSVEIKNMYALEELPLTNKLSRKIDLFYRFE